MSRTFCLLSSCWVHTYVVPFTIITIITIIWGKYYIQILKKKKVRLMEFRNPSTSVSTSTDTTLGQATIFFPWNDWNSLLASFPSFTLSSIVLIWKRKSDLVPFPPLNPPFASQCISSKTQAPRRSVYKASRDLAPAVHSDPLNVTLHLTHQAPTILTFLPSVL